MLSLVSYCVSMPSIIYIEFASFPSVQQRVYFQGTIAFTFQLVLDKNRLMIGNESIFSITL